MVVFTLGCLKNCLFVTENLLSSKKADVHFDIEWSKAIPLKKRLFQDCKELSRTINSGLTNVTVASSRVIN